MLFQGKGDSSTRYCARPFDVSLIGGEAIAWDLG